MKLDYNGGTEEKRTKNGAASSKGESVNETLNKEG